MKKLFITLLFQFILIAALMNNSFAAPTEGCGLSVAPGLTTQSIVVNGVVRTYVQFIPFNYNQDTPGRLVFAWHGRGGSGTTMRSHNVEYILPAQVFIYPNGLPQLLVQNQTGWDLQANGMDMLFYDALVSYLASRFCLDDARILHYGFSMGGYQTNLLMCLRPRTVRAGATVESGLPSSAVNCVSMVPYLGKGNDDDYGVPGGISTIIGVKDMWRGTDQCSSSSTPWVNRSVVFGSSCVLYTFCHQDVVWCEYPSGQHGWNAPRDSIDVANFLGQY